MTFDVIGSGSTGNAVILNGSLMVDCGLPWKQIRPHAKALRLVLLTHEHKDHFKPRTAAALAQERPALRWAACEWMVGPMLEAGIDSRRIDVLEPDREYSYPSLWLTVRPEALFHDVQNCGYHFTIEGEKVFYATDTGSLSGIEAKGYDYYLLEANYEQDELEGRIREKKSAGQYAYEYRAARNHLSKEQAEDWLYQQMGPNSKYLFLHKHDPKGAEKDDAE